jgi:molybdenum cofactor sulfurtransferase
MPQSLNRVSLGMLIPTAPGEKLIFMFGISVNSNSFSATRSDRHIAAARSAVLDFFDAPSSDYVCVFTANATNALKLVGENFPFTSGSSLVIPVDCHNSVNGIRTFAETAGATVEYLESPLWGGIYESDANVSLPLISI